MVCTSLCKYHAKALKGCGEPYPLGSEQISGGIASALLYLLKAVIGDHARFHLQPVFTFICYHSLITVTAAKVWKGFESRNYPE
jgi:hypothetical protein